MVDFTAAYSAFKLRLTKVEAQISTVIGKIRIAAKVWPYWLPAIFVAAIVGHCV